MKADLHIHSNRSYDSLQSPEMIVRFAKRTELDAVAITDHDEFGAHAAAKTAADDLLVIPGMEIRTDDYDDLLALFISEPIKSDRFVSAVDEIHSLGGIAVLPHPYRKIDEYPTKILECVDIIEILNARSKERVNDQARFLGEEVDAPVIGGSDAHLPWEIGRARTVVQGDISSLDDLRAALLSGKCEPQGDELNYHLSHTASLTMEFSKKILQ